MKVLMKLILIMCSVLLISCEGNTDRKWDVSNNSSTKIKVIANDIYYGEIQEFSVGTKASVTINEMSQRGGSENPQEPSDVYSTFVIINDNGDTLTKDHLLLSNWETSITQRSKIPSDYLQEYVFLVSDDDF